MLTLENIKVTLNAGTKLERTVLHNLDLTVASAEFVIIVGGNGSGKSTLFNIISGFLSPCAGSISFAGKDITRTIQSRRANYIAKVMQDPKIGTIENMTIAENMAFAYKRGKRRGLQLYCNHHRQQAFRDKLAMLGMGLEDRMDELVRNLSGGQRQALSLVMAVATDARVLLLDEITAALDPASAQT